MSVCVWRLSSPCSDSLLWATSNANDGRSSHELGNLDDEATRGTCRAGYEDTVSLLDLGGPNARRALHDSLEAFEKIALTKSDFFADLPPPDIPASAQNHILGSDRRSPPGGREWRSCDRGTSPWQSSCSGGPHPPSRDDGDRMRCAPCSQRSHPVRAGGSEAGVGIAASGSLAPPPRRRQPPCGGGDGYGVGAFHLLEADVR